MSVREQMREIRAWLEGDLFREVNSHDLPGSRVWENPAGYRVVLSLRADRTGLAGEVRLPDGSPRATTSWVDVPWLDEKLT